MYGFCKSLVLENSGKEHSFAPQTWGTITEIHKNARMRVTTSVAIELVSSMASLATTTGPMKEVSIYQQ